MRELKVTTSVRAHPDHVWAIVSHFEGYPSWHPLVRWIKLSTDWSTKISARVGAERTLRLGGSLIEHDRPRRVSWDGQHLAWGLIRVRYAFSISPTPTGSDVTQSLKVTGLLPLVAPRIFSSLPDALAETAHALKRQVERQPTSRWAA